MKEAQDEIQSFLKDLLLTVPFLQDYKMVDWTILALSFFGLLVTVKNRVLGLATLSIVDVFWALHDFSVGESAQAFLFLFYSAVTAWGCHSAYEDRKRPKTHV